MNNKSHIEITLDDYKAYDFHIREDAQSRGIENTRLSIYGIYMAVVEKQAAELERYETARKEDARRLEQVTAERDAMREALQKLEYINFPYKMTAVKRCPVCGSPEGDTEHSFDTDCWLAAALKGGKG